MDRRIAEPDASAEALAALEDLRNGSPGAHERLLRLANQYLEGRTQRFLRSFPTVAAWYETGDVRQLTLLRVSGFLNTAEIADPEHFHRLIAKKVREVLLDLKRKLVGAQGLARSEIRLSELGTDVGSWLDKPDRTHDPERLSEWLEVHSAVDSLPESHRTLFDLLWYGELSQEEAASVLGISARQLRRRWREARLELWKRIPGFFDASDSR